MVKFPAVPWTEVQAAIAVNPRRQESLSVPGGAAFSLTAMPTVEVEHSWLPGWSDDTTFTVADAVSFALWARDPLYRTAMPSVRRAMEMEEAQALLHGSEKAWANHNGKGRGWVRKHLEEDLRMRAGGGDPSPDAWESVRTQKRAAQLVDYICVMHGLRLALWWPETGTCTMIPVAGGIPKDASVIQLNCTTGHVLIDQKGAYRIEPKTWPALIAVAKEVIWTPAACSPSAGAATVADIQARIAAIDATADRTGNRVALWTRLMWVTLTAALGC